jgi:EmrB/QacA subfamily drug resistance transporter
MALVAMGLGIFVIANDFTALNVALPAMEKDFDVDVSTSQWVINAYALVFGLAIVTGGRLADMFGRRKVFFIGAAVFAGFSALGAAAPSIEWLIGARVGMGIGGAMIFPATIGMTYAALPGGRAAFAGALILGVAGIGNAVGPLLGGALTDLLSWRWIFIVNVPIAAFAVTVTWFKVHQKEELRREGIDYAGITALSLGLFLLLIALDQATDWGFGDPRIIAMLAASAILIVTFVFLEPRFGSRALVPASVMRNGEFAAACTATLMMSAAFFVTVLYVPQFLIKVLDYSALEAGLGLIPMMGTFAITSFLAASIYERLGPKLVISSGAVALVIGTFALSTIDDASTYSSLLLGLFVVGFGVGLFYSSVTTAAVTALPESQSSLAGGILYMCQIAGGAIGLATITTIFTTTSENELTSQASAAGTDLTHDQESVLHGLLAGTDSATAALAELPTAVQSQIEQIVRDSFVSGLETSFHVVSGVAVVGLIVCVLFVGGRLGRRRKAPPQPGGS